MSLATKNPGAYLYWVDDATSESKILWFDVVTEEDHDLEAEATESPVEKGVDITDHIRPKVPRISVSAFVSNQPLYTKIEVGSALSKKGKLIGVQDGAVSSIAIQPNFGDGAVSPLALVATAISVIRDAIKGPQKYSANVLQFPSEFDNVKEVYEALDTIRTTAQLINVVTRVRTYSNMCIESLSLTRTSDSGDGGSFKIELKQIRVVSVNQVAVIVPKAVNANATVDKGNKNPKEMSESIASKLATKLGNYTGVDINQSYTPGP